MDIQKLIALELGQMDTNQTLLFFAELITTGDIWLLSDKHVDHAAYLINMGAIQSVHEEFKLN